jgi:hypothetical protein
LSAAKRHNQPGERLGQRWGDVSTSKGEKGEHGDSDSVDVVGAESGKARHDHGGGEQATEGHCGGLGDASGQRRPAGSSVKVAFDDFEAGDKPAVGAEDGEFGGAVQRLNDQCIPVAPKGSRVGPGPVGQGE